MRVGLRHRGGSHPEHADDGHTIAASGPALAVNQPKSSHATCAKVSGRDQVTSRERARRRSGGVGRSGRAELSHLC